MNKNEMWVWIAVALSVAIMAWAIAWGTVRYEAIHSTERIEGMNHGLVQCEVRIVGKRHDPIWMEADRCPGGRID